LESDGYRFIGNENETTNSKPTQNELRSSCQFVQFVVNINISPKLSIFTENYAILITYLRKLDKNKGRRTEILPLIS